MNSLEENSTPFVVPSLKERIDAIGSMAGAHLKVKNALQDAEKFWKPVSAPKVGDWLQEHNEDGQTYEKYRIATRNTVGKDGRKTIYIKPLQEMTQEFLNGCLKFCEAYFYSLPVKILKITDVTKLGIDHRINGGKLQYNAGNILKHYSGKVPKDAYCMICILKDDLYPRDSWNFVYGLASITNRIGVFSFARYYPNFYGDAKEDITNIDDIILYRACKVMSHEIGHMFGIKHCVYYSCAMNGSNHEEEAVSRPVELCPVCLRKLQEAIGFSPLDRYIALAKCMKELPSIFHEECKWVVARIEYIQSLSY